MTSEVLRYFLISNHYRSPVDFSDYGMNSSHAALDGFYTMLQRVKEAGIGKAVNSPDDDGVMSAIEVCKKEFIEAMDDDFNTAAAIGSLQKLRRGVNTKIERGISREVAGEISDLFRTFGDITGLFSVELVKWEFLIITPANSDKNTLPFKGRDREGMGLFSDEDIQKLVMDREDARRRTDWKRSDEIRKQLSEAGIILEDRPDGTTRVKR